MPVASLLRQPSRCDPRRGDLITAVKVTTRDPDRSRQKRREREPLGASAKDRDTPGERELDHAVWQSPAEPAPNLGGQHVAAVQMI